MRVEQFEWTEPGSWDRAFVSSTLRDAVQLVILFGDAKAVSAQDCLSRVRQAFPKAHLFGCSTAGEILSTRVREGSLALTAIAFEHSRVAIARASIESLDSSFDAGEKAIRQLDPHGLRHVFVLSEGLRAYSTDVVNGITTALPPGVTVSGGFAADYNLFHSTHVWCDSEPQQSTIIALGFYGDRLHFGLSVT